MPLDKLISVAINAINAIPNPNANRRVRTSNLSRLS